MSAASMSERQRSRFHKAVTERFTRTSGPGGQNVNKVSTAVELRFNLERSGLPESVKVRLRTLAGSRMTGDDEVLIEAHEHRTQSRNREAARDRLLALIDRASRAPKKRRATKPPAQAREGRVMAKQKRSVVKRTRARVSGEE